jgi:phage gp16-like protein
MSRNFKPTPATRNRLIAHIHAAAKELGLDEDTRRDLMERETGKRSASAMNDGELGKVVGALSELKKGSAASAARSFVPHEDPQVRKVYAMWTALKRKGLVTAAKPNGFAKRMAGVDSVEWATPEQLRQIIEGLKAVEVRGKESAPSALRAPPPQARGEDK